MDTAPIARTVVLAAATSALLVVQASSAAAFAPPCRHVSHMLVLLPSTARKRQHHRHVPNKFRKSLLANNKDDNEKGKFDDDPILRRIKAKSSPPRRKFGRRRVEHLPKWFRRLLVSSKFSSMLHLQQGNSIDKRVVTVGNEAKKDKDKSSTSTRLPGSRVLRLLLSSPLVEFKLSMLVFLSSLFVAAGTVQSIPATVHTVIDFGENGIAFIFLLEYLLRWYCNGLRLSHLIKPLVIVDFLSILPLAINAAPNALVERMPFGSGVLRDNLLVNLRLLRLLRLQRFLVDFKTFERFQQAIGVSFGTSIRRYHLQLARVILTIFTLSTVSAGLIYAAEWQQNPTLRDFPSTMYFVVTTVTTVGFGDIYPITAIGRGIVCFMIFAGAAIIPLQVSQFVEALLEFRRDLTEKKNLAGKRKGEDESEETAYELVEAMRPDGTYKKVKTNKVLECQVCNAKPHRKKATFCWSCGLLLWAAKQANFLAGGMGEATANNSDRDDVQ